MGYQLWIYLHLKKKRRRRKIVSYKALEFVQGFGKDNNNKTQK